MTRLKYTDKNHAYYLDGVRAKSVTNIAKRLEDGYNLEKWGKRMVAIGIASHPPLVERIAAHFDDKDALNDIVEEALTHAKTNTASARGSAMHRFTERHDNHEVILSTDLAKATIHAWQMALEEADLEIVEGWTETIVAYPNPRVCGRMDRLVRRRSDGRLFILDLKTGQRALDYPHSIAIQLALYANAPMAFRIDGASGESDEPLVLPEVDRELALVFAMPEPERWSIVPIRIDHAWHVASTVLFPMLAWNDHDDLVLPPIVSHETTPADAPLAPVIDLFAGLHGEADPAATIVDVPPPGPAAAEIPPSPPPLAPAPSPESSPPPTPAVDTVPTGDPAPVGTAGTAPPAVVEQGFTTREWIVERLKALTAYPNAVEAVAGSWPDGVPGLASNALLSPAEWQRVDACIAAVEAYVGAPFVPGPRNHETPRATWLATAVEQGAVTPGAPAVAQEAPDAAEGAVEAVCEAMAGLQGAAAEWATRMLVEARAGGAAVALRTVRSHRLVCVGWAIHAWAKAAADDALVRLGFALLPSGTLIDDRPLGVMFGTLSAAEAEQLWHIGQGVGTGEWRYTCDDQHGERFVQMARA